MTDSSNFISCALSDFSFTHSLNIQFLFFSKHVFTSVSRELRSNKRCGIFECLSTNWLLQLKNFRCFSNKRNEAFLKEKSWITLIYINNNFYTNINITLIIIVSRTEIILLSHLLHKWITMHVGISKNH